MKSLPRFHDPSLDPPLSDSTVGRSWSGLPATDEVDLVGQSLNGTYVVESVLGEGGMGRVYQAHHVRIASKKLAVKVLRPEFARNAEVIARFRREAETAACISHPNVIGVFDVDVTLDGHFYLVCEHLSGIDLAERLDAKSPLDIPEAVHIILQVCRGLEAATARGVVHRDLKPHNVFLLAEPNGTVPERPDVKVLDFGLSRVMDSPGTQLTQTGVIMGTPAYMAPEQAQGAAVDHRTDIYGVGALLFTALTGRPPYQAETLQAVVLAVMTEEAPLPRSLNPSIPENLELVIQRAMARNPADRYASMSALREALEPFAEPLSIARGGPKSTQNDLRAQLKAEARAVGLARPRLLFLGFVGVLFLILGLVSSIPSVELFFGTLRFTRIEIFLILLAIAGTLLTPAVLLYRLLRRTVWGNHARVLELLAIVRGALISALVGYALASASVRFLEDVVSRFDLLPFVTRGSGVRFAGWNLIFLIVALTMAGAASLRQRLVPRGGMASWLGPLLYSAGAVLAAGAVYLGFLWKGSLIGETGRDATAPSASEARAAATAALDPVEPANTPEDEASAAAPPSASAAPSEPPGARAPNEELALARVQGVDGLLPLSERFPRDPAVLESLVRAFASRATGLADAMTIAKRLFEVAPERTRDPDLRLFVKKAAGTPGQTSKLGFELLASGMGSDGPDILYELVLTEPKVARRAEELLAANPEVRERATPALSIANELRTAPSCAARLPLLERATQVGDERSAMILSPLSAGSKRGCGRRKNKPCPPPCPSEAEEYLKAVKAIMARAAKR